MAERRTMTWRRLEKLVERTNTTFQGSAGPDGTVSAMKRDDVVKVMREHRFLRRPVAVPIEYQEVTDEFRSPMPFDMVSRVVADITHMPPVLRVTPLSDSIADKENSSLREQWATAALESMDDAHKFPPWKKCADAQVGDGRGILKLSYHPKRYSTDANYPVIEDFEDAAAQNGHTAADLHMAAIQRFKRKADFPFSWRQITVEKYRPILGPDDEVTAVIEIHELDVEILLETFSDKVTQDSVGQIVPRNPDDADMVVEDAQWTGRGDSGAIKVIEYWDKHEWGQWAEGVKLDGGDNPFGERLPYFEAYGIITSSPAPEEEAVSVLYPLTGVYDQTNTEVSKMSSLSHSFAYPSWKRTGGIIPTDLEEDDDEEGDEEQVIPGHIYDLELGGDLGPLMSVEFGQVSQAFLGILLSMVDQVGLSAITKGVGLGAEASGHLFSQIDAAAHGVYSPIAEGLASSIADVVQAMFWCIEHTIKTSVVVKAKDENGTVDFLELAPGDIDGYYDISATLNPRKPSSKMARGNFAAGMVKARLMDRETAMEQIDDPHPERTVKRIDDDEMRATPAYRSAKFQYGAARAMGTAAPKGGGGTGNAPRGGPPPNRATQPAGAQTVGRPQI